MSEKTKAYAQQIALSAVNIILDWIFTCAVLYVVCLCFAIQFNIREASGIWLFLRMFDSRARIGDEYVRIEELEDN